MLEASKLFESLNHLNVLIVGDVMIDRYLIGGVNRISPEAPVPVVHLHKTDNRLGGAANVALNIRALGATPYLCSVIGSDDDAGIFHQLLDQNHIPSLGILQSESRITTVKTRVVAGSQQLLRIDNEVTDDLSKSEESRFLHKLKHILDTTRIHVILLQDYNKGVLTKSVIHKIMQEAIRRNIPTTVDPKQHNFFEYKQATLFKPNLKEVRDALMIKVLPEKESLILASDQIRQKIDNQITMITLSEKGLFVDDHLNPIIVGTHARSIADVSGAGDTVISIASLGLALGLDLNTIAILANLAGGQVCEQSGVVPVNKAILKKEYETLMTTGTI